MQISKKYMNSTALIKRRCSNPTFLKKFLIYASIKRNKLNTKGKTLAEEFINIYGQIK